MVKWGSVTSVRPFRDPPTVSLVATPQLARQRHQLAPRPSTACVEDDPCSYTKVFTEERSTFCCALAPQAGTRTWDPLSHLPDCELGVRRRLPVDRRDAQIARRVKIVGHVDLRHA